MKVASEVVIQPRLTLKGGWESSLLFLYYQRVE